MVAPLEVQLLLPVWQQLVLHRKHTLDASVLLKRDQNRDIKANRDDEAGEKG